MNLEATPPTNLLMAAIVLVGVVNKEPNDPHSIDHTHDNGDSGDFHTSTLPTDGDGDGFSIRDVTVDSTVAVPIQYYSTSTLQYQSLVLVVLVCTSILRVRTLEYGIRPTKLEEGTG